MAIQAFLLLFLDLLLFCPAFTEHVADNDKIDCYPENGNKSLCESRGCTWEETSAKVIISVGLLRDARLKSVKFYFSRQFIQKAQLDFFIQTN